MFEGLAVSGDVIKPRKESDDAHLRGLGDIDSTVRGGAFASYTLDWFTLRGSVLSDLGSDPVGRSSAARFFFQKGCNPFAYQRRAGDDVSAVMLEHKRVFELRSNLARVFARHDEVRTSDDMNRR
jgi:hypothetical protein